MSSTRILTASLFALASAAAATTAFGQSQGYEGFRRETSRALTARPRPESGSSTHRSQMAVTELSFKNRADSLNWARNKALAARSTGFRVIVSLQEHHVWVVTDDDTLLSAPAAVAKGTTLTYDGFEHSFDTPRGLRQVLDKSADPIWNPPDWLYYETAKEYGLKIERIPSKGTLKLPDGKKLAVEDNKVIVIDSLGPTDFPTEYHIIFGNTLYIPPIGTENRRVDGTLGKYKLNLGDGYMLHGTDLPGSIGLAATHGCIRLRDDDIEWMYENVNVGTRVYIY
jgi:L,D-transpeptidase-like protein